MEFKRHWALPSKHTFTIKPIRALVKWYLQDASISVDPFARNSQLCTYTNDLNRATSAAYNLPANEFLRILVDKKVKADLVLFDPPYSRRQVMECYQGIGQEFTNKDSQYFSINWKNERETINSLVKEGGHVISFGWQSNGMQQSGNYEIEQILLVAHGGAHHDTIVTVERKLENKQNTLFECNTQ